MLQMPAVTKALGQVKPTNPEVHPIFLHCDRGPTPGPYSTESYYQWAGSKVKQLGNKMVPKCEADTEGAGNIHYATILTPSHLF